MSIRRTIKTMMMMMMEEEEKEEEEKEKEFVEKGHLILGTFQRRLGGGSRRLTLL